MRTNRRTENSEAHHSQGKASDVGIDDALKQKLDRAIDRMIEEKIDVRMCQSPVPPLWTVNDVADYLNVSKRTVEKLIADKEIRFIRIRNQRRFDRDAIVAYARSHVERAV